MPVFNEYIYRPLSEHNSIRLVILHPNSEEVAPITCEIVELQTSAPVPDYEAVSYVWGPLEHSRTLEIQCDGDTKYLRITPNLDTLLKGLRLRDETRSLWIDALCLDQSDHLEKAQQIPAMGAIYKTATIVVVWLGLDEPVTARVLAFCRKLSRLPDVTEWRTQSEMAKRIVFLMRKFFLGGVGEALQAIHNFFSQRWFSRRWIIQEACVNSNTIVRCGSLSVPLSVLRLAATRFQRLDMSHYGLKVAANLGSQSNALSILELLWHFHESDCLEQKDRIAALLSLGLDMQQFRLDYTKHWKDIYMDFAAFAYSRGDHNTSLQMLLHLFEFGSVPKGARTHYPSWVPDWSSARRRTLPYSSYIRNPDTFEPYPKSPRGCVMAAVAFHCGFLDIYWNHSITNPGGCRVVFATTLDSSHSTKESKKKHTLETMERLFPQIPGSELEITAFAVLLMRVSDFRHPVAKRESTSRSLGRFERKVLESQTHLNCEQLLIWLRTLESVLQYYSLVKLEALGPRCRPIRGYGFGPKSMRVDDIAIPLWTLDSKSLQPENLTSASELIEIPVLTMLVVRRVEEQTVLKSDTEREIGLCRIIGPAICVTLTGENENQCEHSDGTKQEEWSLLRII